MEKMETAIISAANSIPTAPQVDTQRAYRADVGKPLAQAIGEGLEIADGLTKLAPTSQARILSAVKSLLAFGHRLGVLPVAVGAALKPPSTKNALAARTLPKAVV